MAWLDYLRELNLASVVVRLLLAMFVGGLVGVERGRKRRAAGFRTYMLVSIGAALTMLLGQYQAALFDSDSDIARYGAQVINGIGFLGAGTILLTGRKEVRGLTTAAALWACACMGLAIGAGFYEGVLLGVILIFLCVRVLPLLEHFLLKRSRNMNLYVEFSEVRDVRRITSCVKGLGATVLDVEVDPGQTTGESGHSAILYLRLNRRLPHAEVLAAVFHIESIHKVDEL